MSITSIYAALVAFLFLVLSIRVIRVRHRTKIAFGAADDPGLERRIRVHGNFTEYVPFALLLIAFAESGGAPAWIVHALGLTLVLARVAHAYGVSQANENFRFRVFGTASTFGVVASAAIVILFLVIAASH